MRICRFRLGELGELGELSAKVWGELTWVSGWFQFTLVVGNCGFLKLLLELHTGIAGVGATLKRSSMLDMAELPDDQATRLKSFQYAG